MFGFLIESKIGFLIFCIICVVFVWYVIANLVSSPFGRVLRALSEDEIFTKSLGKNVSQAKIVSFTISGMLASIAGVLYAHYIGYINPSVFSIDESIFILSIVIIGGMRSLKNIFFATVFLVLLPEALRFVGLPSNIAANLRQIFYGIALVLVVFKYGNKNKKIAPGKQTQKEIQI